MRHLSEKLETWYELRDEKCEAVLTSLNIFMFKPKSRLLASPTMKRTFVEWANCRESPSPSNARSCLVFASREA